jgi:hypothetical protein
MINSSTLLWLASSLVAAIVEEVRSRKTDVVFTEGICKSGQILIIIAFR